MDELKIIKYLDGEMSTEESLAFEEEIRSHPTLAEEVEKFRQIQDMAVKLLAQPGTGEETETGMDPAVEEEISDAVQDFKSRPESFDKVSPEYRRELERARKRFGGSGEANAPVRMIRRIWYRTAAIIILALALSVLLFRPFEKMDPEEVYERYFKTFDKTLQVADLVRDDNDFLFAVEVYEAGDFDRASILFEMLADSAVLRPWSLFYAGSSYLSLHQTEKAISLFRTAIEEGNEEVLSHARWQLSLALIRRGEQDLALEQLQILVKDPLYRKDVKRIIRILY
jgi:tetratricopeptide (TPR) repeat protein